MIGVSWEDAQAYCVWLSQQTGQTWRLPTEVEWEYAAGGGASGRTTWAGTSTESSVGNYAVYGSKGSSKTQPVKSKLPNRLGLYDMSGNVWEWCQDWYDSSYYASSPSQDPTGASLGAFRVRRGGSWDIAPVSSRVSNRGWHSGHWNRILGFRPARTL
ncbi:MAG: hypothetical protein OHK0039_44270 [Bacteroidia bacterium]